MLSIEEAISECWGNGSTFFREYWHRFLDQEMVRTLLDYNPASGVLSWRWRERKWFVDDGQWRTWNTKNAGKPALNCIDSKGYLVGSIFNRLYHAHRVIWLLMTGQWPNPEVDHIDHNGANNRFDNLRETTCQGNSKNQSLYVTNTSGRIGVHWERRRNKWRAVISMVDGHHLHLGYFDTLEEACAARDAAEIAHGYHVNHGKRSAA